MSAPAVPMTCPTCNGDDDHCRPCRGSGEVWSDNGQPASSWPLADAGYRGPAAPPAVPDPWGDPWQWADDPTVTPDALTQPVPF